LTPLGDPPLFLGYLAGVPFGWTLHLMPHWLVTTLLLLAVYYVWDTRAYRRETVVDRMRDQLLIRPLRLAGKENLVLLLGVVASVALLPFPGRETAMLLLALVSLRRTPAELRRANGFSFHPIGEVGALFAGIFVTMLPALD